MLESKGLIGYRFVALRFYRTLMIWPTTSVLFEFPTTDYTFAHHALRLRSPQINICLFLSRDLTCISPLPFHNLHVVLQPPLRVTTAPNELRQHATLVGGDHVLDVDEGVLAAVNLEHLQHRVNQIPQAVVLALAVVHGVTQVVVLRFEDVEDGQDLSVVRHQRFANHVSGQDQ